MALIDARRDLHLLQPKEDSDRGKNGATEEATTARNRRHGGQAFLTAKKRRFGDDDDDRSRERAEVVALV